MREDSAPGSQRAVNREPPTPHRGSRWVVAIAVALLALQVGASALGSYGYFIDEFYYLACARRLAFGYVDHPPLSIAVLAVTRALLGESVTAIRLPAMLAVAAVPLVAARLARRLGGGPFAEVLAALSVAVSPVALTIGSFFSMNAFELLLWPVVALALVDILDGGDPRRWLMVGLLLGLGLENKHTTVLLGVAIAVGLLLTPSRRLLRGPWPWAGAALALALLLPNVLWQRAHGFPSLEFYRNAQLLKNVSRSPLQVLSAQVLFAGPGSLPVWVAGAAWLLRARAGRPYRALGWAFVALLALMIAARSSRPDRIAGFYPVLFGAGAVAVEAWLFTMGATPPNPRSGLRDVRRRMRIVVAALVVLPTAALAPLAMPLLPPAATAAYGRRLDVVPPMERGHTSPLPQWIADRTGWEAFVADVEAVYRSLPPDDQARAVVFCSSYGHAGAVELLGPARGLPRVIGSQNSYWTWADEPSMPEVLIAVGAREKDLAAIYAEHRVAAVHRCTYCPSWRSEMAIVVAKGPRVPFREAWANAKHFE